MKRILILFACLVMVSSSAYAEALPGASSEPETDSLIFSPEDTQSEATPEPESVSEAVLTSEGELQLDFSVLTPDNPLATPVAVDPIDKPTPSPTPAPNYWYDTYTNTDMGISFSIPGTWLLNPNTNLDTTIQFVEPKEEMMEPDGYQTRLTVEKVNMGLAQTASDARTQLESTLETLGMSFTDFKAGDIDSAAIGDARGYYCYYRAEYNDGTKTYSMNGRIMVIAKDRALYQIRITTPRSWYSYYENVYRKVRSTFTFL
ncbi:MAG: hypothetical protein Q4F18_09705 [Clostridia bacterium]|nr:hypothetical protein [Clostridia bacterium]